MWHMGFSSQTEDTTLAHHCVEASLKKQEAKPLLTQKSGTLDVKIITCIITANESATLYLPAFSEAKVDPSHKIVCSCFFLSNLAV